MSNFTKDSSEQNRHIIDLEQSNLSVLWQIGEELGGELGNAIQARVSHQWELACRQQDELEFWQDMNRSKDEVVYTASERIKAYQNTVRKLIQAGHDRETIIRDIARHLDFDPADIALVLDVMTGKRDVSFLKTETMDFNAAIYNLIVGIMQDIEYQQTAG